MSFLCVFAIKVFQHISLRLRTPRKTPARQGFFRRPFSLPKPPLFFFGAEILPARSSKNGVKEWFLLNWSCVLGFLNAKSIPTPRNFGQKSYQIQKLWPSLTLWTEPLLPSSCVSSSLSQRKVLSLHQPSKSWVRVYFFGKFHNSWNWAGISWWQFLSTKELGIQLCRHHIQVTRQIHRLVGDVKKTHTLQHGPGVA